MIARGGGRPEAYRLADGAKVPGVTTIIGRWKESGGLIRWAWNEGREGRTLEQARDTAGSIGAVVHDAVEAHINGMCGEVLIDKSLLDDSGRGKALKAYQSYLAWERMMRVRFIATEVPLVSETYRFGGTVDAVAEIDDKLVIVDWKTSKGVYADYLLQLAGYALLWEECKGLKIEAYHLCRFSKEAGSFSHSYFDDLELAKRQFIRLREAYEDDKLIAKMI